MENFTFKQGDRVFFDDEYNQGIGTIIGFDPMGNEYTECCPYTIRCDNKIPFELYYVSEYYIRKISDIKKLKREWFSYRIDDWGSYLYIFGATIELIDYTPPKRKSKKVFWKEKTEEIIGFMVENYKFNKKKNDNIICKEIDTLDDRYEMLQMFDSLNSILIRLGFTVK